MNQQLHKRGLWSIDELSSDDVQTLLATARSLKQAQGRGVPLKGKHMAVLGDRSAGTGSDVFTMAALGLGAQVTHIPPRTLRLTASGDMGDAGRILGRLYDAIECDGMGEAFMLALKGKT